MHTRVHPEVHSAVNIRQNHKIIVKSVFMTARCAELDGFCVVFLITELQLRLACALVHQNNSVPQVLHFSIVFNTTLG